MSLTLDAMNKYVDLDLGMIGNTRFCFVFCSISNAAALTISPLSCEPITNVIVSSNTYDKR